MSRLLLLFSFCCLLGCAQEKVIEQPIKITDGRPSEVSVDISAIPDAVPQFEPWSPSVNPPTYTVLGKPYKVLATNKGYVKKGIASWYGTKFHQHKTATGEEYDMFAMTAAHKTLPIPSYVRVTHLDSQKSIVVRVNDRGPFHEHRIIDLSYAAAVKLGLEKSGTGFVEVVAVFPETNLNNTHAVSAQKIYIQIGAFGAKENALNLQQRFAELRITTSRVVSVKVAGGSVYKVQVGPVSSVEEADDITIKIKNIGVHKSHFISE